MSCVLYRILNDRNVIWFLKWETFESVRVLSVSLGILCLFIEMQEHQYIFEGSSPTRTFLYLSCLHYPRSVVDKYIWRIDFLDTPVPNSRNRKIINFTGVASPRGTVLYQRRVYRMEVPDVWLYTVHRPAMQKNVHCNLRNDFCLLHILTSLDSRGP